MHPKRLAFHFLCPGVRDNEEYRIHEGKTQDTNLGRQELHVGERQLLRRKAFIAFVLSATCSSSAEVTQSFESRVTITMGTAQMNTGPLLGSEMSYLGHLQDCTQLLCLLFLSSFSPCPRRYLAPEKEKCVMKLNLYIL